MKHLNKWPLNFCIPLFFYLCFGGLTTPVFGQQPTDCSNALVVCGNTGLSLNSNGTGINDFAVASNNEPDCGFRESQSLWLRVPILSAGTLSFTILPNNGSDDFDFAIYGPNVDCQSIGSAIRCSSTNPQAAGVSAATGLRPGEPETSEGPGALGNGYVRSLEVSAGEEYLILIDNWSQSNEGFVLNWSGTAVISADPPIANRPANLRMCDTNPDHVEIFDLSQQVADIVNGQTNVSVTFHTSEEDAIIGADTINSMYENTGNPQTIYARLTNDNTGCSDVTSFQLEVLPLPVIDRIIGVQSVCPGVSGVPYEVVGALRNSYQWSVDGGTITSDSTSAQIMVDWGASSDTSQLKLLVENEEGCFLDTIFYPVRINLALEPSTPVGLTELCYEERNGITYSVPFSPGSVYDWTVENGNIIGGNTSNSIEVNWNGTGVGRLYFTESNPSIALCEGYSDTLNVTIFEEIVVNDTIIPPSCYGGNDAWIALTVSGGVGNKVVEWPGGQTGDTLRNLRADTVVVQISDERGCEITREFIIEDRPELLIQGIEIDSILCYGQSDGRATADVTGGFGTYQYHWTGDSLDITTSQNVIDTLTAGTYQLEVTDGNGCTAVQSFTITQPPLLETDLANFINQPICPGTNDGVITVGAMGGTAPYQFFWETSPPQTGEMVTDLAAGNYQVRIVDMNGCETTFETQVQEQFPRVFIPEAFSPNGDGNNDIFIPISRCVLDDYSLKIFNRWGSMVFLSEEITNGWDGSYEGRIVEGFYSYVVSYRSFIGEAAFEETIRGGIRLFK